ncbi:hypothetical protein ACHAXA_010879 [Cyclostephanos tholiformis]|uniref:Transmembrane protein n=1 Tax=Cyclostephanos tholiformis TaxID=382380 RepID=A0ABD3SDB6_9STRA
MNSLVPAFILFILLVASTATIVVIFSSSIHSLKIAYQADIAMVNKQLATMQSQQSTFQSAYAAQVKGLTKLVSESLNATDEYITNFTDTVEDASETIYKDLASVQDLQENQNSLLAVQFAGMFTILVILVSGYHLSQHLRHMNLPVVQRKIMAVLWMTPIYSLSSWLSLVFVDAEPYLAVVREFYESYCVYMFLSFLIAVLGRGDRRAVITLLELRADQLSRPDKCRCGPKACKRWWSTWRNRCCRRKKVSLTDSVDAQVPGVVDEYGNYVSPDRIKAEAVLDQCQLYAMQFVLLRPLTGIAWLVSNQLVEPKKFLDPTTPQLYITIVTNISIFLAFRGLVRFYHATRSNLDWCDPWPKFLCIKGVVFMTFWQRMVLSFVVNVAFPDKFDSQEEADDFVMRAQNFLICLEMLFSAVAHCFVFPTEEWEEGYREKEEARRRDASARAFGDSVALGDFLNDIKTVMTSKKRRSRRRTQEGGGLSPISTGSGDEVDTLDLSLNESVSGDDGENSPGDDFSRHTRNTRAEPRRHSAESRDRPRRRLDTEESIESDDGGVGGSFARIEKFINQHTPPRIV